MRFPLLLFNLAISPFGLKDILMELEAEEAALKEARQRKWEQDFRKGRLKGQEEERQKWEAWLKRYDDAKANNQPFDEPPPSR